MSAMNTGWSKGPCVRTELIFQHRLAVAVVECVCVGRGSGFEHLSHL